MITYSENDIYRSEGEIAEALAVFDSEYVFRLIDYGVQKRFNKHFIPIPNIVNSFKTVFDNLRIQYHVDKENTDRKEEEIYDEIIRCITQNCNLVFNAEQATTSKFIIASTLYDVFVSNFSEYFITFLYDIVIKEKDNIYDYLESNGLIREKDCETIYNLKKMNDNKLAIIIANFDRAMQCLMELDIAYDDFIVNTFNNSNKHIVEIMLYNFAYNGHFFSDSLKVIFSDNNLFSIYINEIRLYFMGV